MVKSEGTNRLARLNVDSNYPLKFLSPESRARRVSRIVKDRKNLSAKQLCSRGDGLGEGNMLRAAWEEDVCERLEYEKDQAKSGRSIV